MVEKVISGVPCIILKRMNVVSIIFRFKPMAKGVENQPRIDFGHAVKDCEGEW